MRKSSVEFEKGVVGLGTLFLAAIGCLACFSALAGTVAYVYADPQGASLAEADASGEEALISIQQKGRWVILSIANTSDLDDLKVNRVFTQNPAFGVIRMNVFENGVAKGLVMPPNENLPTEGSYVKLSSHGVVGQAFEINEIRSLYGVKGRCFMLSVIYHDIFAENHSAYQGIMQSGQIKVCALKGS